jgi:broad specificity phosphatase PhoE
MTAEAIHMRQAHNPSLHVSSLLREQHFGIAEGKHWQPKGDPGVTLEENIARGVYPTITTRKDKFPEGESLDDLNERARKVLDETLLPYVKQAAESGQEDIHIAIASHGLFIKECLISLFVMDAEQKPLPSEVLSGLKNTGWTRIIVEEVCLHHF